jgi:hypothetical protein
MQPASMPTYILSFGLAAIGRGLLVTPDVRRPRCWRWELRIELLLCDKAHANKDLANVTLGYCIHCCGETVTLGVSLTPAHCVSPVGLLSEAVHLVSYPLAALRDNRRKLGS